MHADLYCPLEKILSVPNRDGYRNKCEFTIGMDSNSAVLTHSHLSM
jgi:hypothetical protein